MRNICYTLRLTSFLTFFLFAAQFASAQSGTLKGTVRDGNGDPLFGASITVAGKKQVLKTKYVMVPFFFIKNGQSKKMKDVALYMLFTR